MVYDSGAVQPYTLYLKGSSTVGTTMETTGTLITQTDHCSSAAVSLCMVQLTSTHFQVLACLEYNNEPLLCLKYCHLGRLPTII